MAGKVGLPLADRITVACMAGALSIGAAAAVMFAAWLAWLALR